MGFREFITNWRYRRKLAAELERYHSIEPPANPSRRYLDKLVRRLLKQRTAWDARRELSLLGTVAVPLLVSGLNDPRFHRAEWKKYSSAPVPLDSILELLVPHASDEVVKVASTLVKSPSARVREIAALHLASSAHVETMPILRALMEDGNGSVRSYVRMGLHRAASEGRAGEEFRRKAYDLLLAQCDQDWGDSGNDAAETIVVLDPARAAVDLGDERLLRLSNKNSHRILKACNQANIPLPEEVVRPLFEAALAVVSDGWCYPNDYIAAEALRALSLRAAHGVQATAAALLEHENEKIKEAAASSLATLAGIGDPVEFVLDIESEQGYAALSSEQRVVYCAYLFDAEVCNGGLMQFLGNSSGNHAVDTLAALEALGHHEALTALETALRLIGPVAREPERELRLTGIEGRWNELKPAFEPLEKAYFATKARLRQAWFLYAIRHAASFSAEP